MQGWTWRAVIFGALVTVLIYTATRPDPETSELFQSSSSQLVKLLGSSRDVVRRGAAARLLNRGAEAVPALLEAAPFADEEDRDQIFLVLEDLYVSSDLQAADAAEEALEQLANHEERDVRQAADAVFQSNIFRRHLRACSKVESFGGRLVSSASVARGMEMQFPLDIVVIDENWTGGERGLKYLPRIKNLGAVHLATAAPFTEAVIDGLARKLGDYSVGIRRESEACLGLEIIGRTDQSVPVQTISVRRMAAGSPASLAGFQRDDLIIEMAGRPLETPADYFQRLREVHPGDTLTLVVQRDGQLITLNVALGSDFGTGRCRCHGDVSEQDEIAAMNEESMRGRNRFPVTTDRISPFSQDAGRPAQRPLGNLMPAGQGP